MEGFLQCVLMAVDGGQAAYYTILLALIIFWLLILKNSRACLLWIGHGYEESWRSHTNVFLELPTCCSLKTVVNWREKPKYFLAPSSKYSSDITIHKSADYPALQLFSSPSWGLIKHYVNEYQENYILFSLFFSQNNPFSTRRWCLALLPGALNGFTANRFSQFWDQAT